MKIVYISGRTLGRIVYRMTTEALQFQPSLSFGAGSSAQAGATANGDVSSTKKILFLPGYVESILKDLKGGVPKFTSNEVTQWGFIPGSVFEYPINKYCSEEVKAAIKEADTSLITTKTAQKAVEKAFDVKFTSEAGKLMVNAAKEGTESTLKTKAGKVAANALGMTTKGGIAFSAACEISDIKKAYDNNDLSQQLVRSGGKITAASFLANTCGSIAKSAAPAPLKTACMVGAMIAGGCAANAAVDKTVDVCIGESVAKKKEETEKKITELKQKESIETV